MRFENVNTGLLESCAASAGTGTFVELEGTGNRDIPLICNPLARAAHELSLWAAQLKRR